MRIGAVCCLGVCLVYWLLMTFGDGSIYPKRASEEMVSREEHRGKMAKVVLEGGGLGRKPVGGVSSHGGSSAQEGEVQEQSRAEPVEPRTPRKPKNATRMSTLSSPTKPATRLRQPLTPRKGARTTTFEDTTRRGARTTEVHVVGVKQSDGPGHRSKATTTTAEATGTNTEPTSGCFSFGNDVQYVFTADYHEGRAHIAMVKCHKADSAQNPSSLICQA